MSSSALRFGVIGLMTCTAVVLGVVVLNVTQSRQPTVQAAVNVPAPLQLTYLVAAHPLPAGTLARDEDFATRSVPNDKLPSQAIIDTPAARAALRGSLVRVFIDTGTQINTADVLRPRDRGFIASVLTPGTRAVSIAVDPVAGVAGLIWPGDYVEVILTQDLDKDAPIASRALSEVILSNVRVIAVDQEMVQGASADNNTAGKLAKTVTVQVDNAEAQKIAIASHIGRLSLAIRAATDTPDAIAAPVFSGDVSPALVHADKPVGTKMRIIEGDKVREVTFP